MLPLQVKIVLLFRTLQLVLKAPQEALGEFVLPELATAPATSPVKMIPLVSPSFKHPQTP